MAERQRFQGLCLEGDEGRLYMWAFDKMPPDIRELLRYCPYNLCAACVSEGKRPEWMVAMIRAEIPEKDRQLLPEGKNRLLKSRVKPIKKVPGGGNPTGRDPRNCCQTVIRGPER